MGIRRDSFVFCLQDQLQAWMCQFETPQQQQQQQQQSHRGLA